MRCLVIPIAFAILWPAFAEAKALTCEQFKARLATAISDDGDHIAQIREYHPDGPAVDGGKSYSWDDIVGLNGSLSCGPQDEFGDFSATMPLDDGLKAIIFGRFAKLATLTVCALSSSTEDACSNFTSNMLDISTSALKQQIDRGEKYPVGTCDFYLFPSVDAELDVSAQSFDWSIGPGKFMKMDDSRLPLAPERRDVD